MILGTLPTPTLNLSSSDSAGALFYTNPANASVKLNDTYSTFQVVKYYGDCSKSGYFRVELGIGENKVNFSLETLPNLTLNQWNITMEEEECISDHGIYVVKMNITFDNKTINRVWSELKDGTRTPISIRFIFIFYTSTQQRESSSKAFISIKDPNDGDEVGGSRGEDSVTYSDNSEGVMINNVADRYRMQSNAVSSYLQLRTVTEILILLFCSLIVLSLSI